MRRSLLGFIAILLVILAGSLFMPAVKAASAGTSQSSIYQIQKNNHPKNLRADGSILDEMKQRFLRDVTGNTLATIVLLGMVVSLVLVTYNFVMGDPEQAKPWPRWVIPILAMLGMGVAIYMSFVETTKIAAFCGPIGDCNSVQKSQYAVIFGVLPVGVLGLIGYLAILAAWITQLFSSERWRNLLSVAIWGMAVFGVLFSIYLTFLEPFVIGATCIWCISSAIIITLLLWASTPPAKLATSSTDELQDEYPLQNA